MTVANTLQRRSRPVRPDAATHRFAVGQIVRLKGNFGTFLKTADIYRITGTLPPRGNSPQYRIRNDDERHERVTTQDSLEPVDMSLSGDDTARIGKDFSHGQGTETQQSGNPKAETEQGGAAQI